MGIVGTPGKTFCAARSSAWKPSVSRPEGGVAGERWYSLRHERDGRIIDHFGQRGFQRGHVFSGRARTSKRASASAGITLERKPPLMIVGTREVRSME